MRQWWRATMNSWHGLGGLARSEATFRQELIALALAVPLSFVVAQAAWQRLTLIAVILLVLVIELLNTAIEKLCDRISRSNDAELGWIKDMASAAVGLTLLIAALTWIVALAELIGAM